MTMRPLILALSVAALATPAAQAGPFRCHRRHKARCVAPPVASHQISVISRKLNYTVPPTTYVVPAPFATPQSDAAGPLDATAWLNAVRARSGLGPVAYDAGLAADASANSAGGFGHSFMGRARRQNVGVGPIVSVQVAWLASPLHASAILDPTITRAAIVTVNGVTTFSAN